MSVRSVVGVAMVALLALGRSVATQEVANDAQAWRTLTSRLGPGATVQVRLKDGRQLRGSVVPGGDEALRIKPHTRVPVPILTVAFEDVDSIERWKEGLMPGVKVLLGVAAGVGGLLVTTLVLIASGD
jgi:hypothetical protein